MEIRCGEGDIFILVERQGYEGVKRIAQAVAGDFERVFGWRPECISEEALAQKENRQIIFCATVDRSALLDSLEREGKVSLDQVRGKREVFALKMVERPFAGVDRALVICGSDKRGTIYGMFTLSEYIGVTPLVYWGDAAPARRECLSIGQDIEQVSGEPSVKYRGFFINDEWPCFGNWVCSHFGGFGAEAYQCVFEFLLRMKGNYLWPAMWSASFPLDGPGSANEELADIYGVVIGYSHHEPCLRASEEWDKVKGPGTRYGNAWNFYTNEEGLLNYWTDSLKRSGGYENIITIGMRGERDTSMLGGEASVEENIRLLKDIIKKQRALIAEYVGKTGREAPQMIALYKEVEQYFYGDGNAEGLKDFEELDDVVCMLCEDNFGHMRALPPPDMRDRKGGWGMYYHFDYHGGPVSYEWVDSTPLSQTWEQMCMAYEYGIRDIWIVNVGDVKFHEVPLSYFMALAYDYDKWGYGNPDSYKEFMMKWAAESFPQASAQVQKDAVSVLEGYIRLNHMRRPESLHEGVYHPCHYGETDRMLASVRQVETLSEDVMDRLLPGERDAWYSMVHFPAMASMNLLKMHLYAGKNVHYASQGRQKANEYGELVSACIQNDRRLAEEFADFAGGKWDGMQLAQHIGFTKWNEDGYRYPVICRVEPVHKPRLSVSRADDEAVADKTYGAPMVIKVDDFLYPDCDEVTLEIANDGIGTLRYQILPDGAVFPGWLSLSACEGDVEVLERVTFRCDRCYLEDKRESARIFVTDGDTRVAVDILAKRQDLSGLPKMTFVSSKDAIVIGAAHYCGRKDTEKGRFRVMKGYGKYGAGVKVFPGTAAFGAEEEKPELTYRFLIDEEGMYTIELLTAPNNSAAYRQGVRVMLDNHLGCRETLELIPADFRAGESSDGRWAQGVLNQIRVSRTAMHFGEGVQELTVGAMEAGVVLEQLRIYQQGTTLKKSYLGPEESLCVQ